MVVPSGSGLKVEPEVTDGIDGRYKLINHRQCLYPCLEHTEEFLIKLGADEYNTLMINIYFMIEVINSAKSSVNF